MKKTKEQKEEIARAFKRGHTRKLYESIKMCNKAYDRGRQETQAETQKLKRDFDQMVIDDRDANDIVVMVNKWLVKNG